MPITDLATNVILDNVGKVYFLKTGVYRDQVGLDNNHPLSSVSALLIHIEDGVPQNVMVANYAPSKMASWASHDFPLWYRGQVEYTITGESSPRTFAQYFTYVPSILVAMNKNGTSIMDVNVTITQSTGANLLGGFADLTALNAEYTPTEELSDDLATAYVYDSGTKGFYRVAWNSGTSAWVWQLVDQALVTYGVQTKQYNVLPIKVQRGYAPNQTPLTVSDEVIRLIYQEIAYVNAVIANHTELIDDLELEVINNFQALKSLLGIATENDWNFEGELPSDVRFPNSRNGWCQVGSDFYVFGGSEYIGTGLGFTTDYRRKAYKYNAVTKEWTELSDLPINMDEQRCVEKDGYIYIMCGGKFQVEDLDKNYKYEIATDTYTLIANPPDRIRNTSGAVLIDDNIYIMVDSYYTPGEPPITSIHINTTPYIYNITTDTWTTETSANTSFDRGFSYYYEGKIYVQRSLKFQSYDPVTDTWDETLTPPTYGLVHTGLMHEYRGRLFIGSGWESAQSKNTSFIQYYNVSKDKWFTATRLEVQSHALGYGSMFMYNNKLYYLGGYSNDDDVTRNVVVRSFNLEKLQLDRVDALYEQVYDLEDRMDTAEEDIDDLETFQNVTVPATYETIANADTHRGRTTALENANMVKSIERTGTNLITITYFDDTTSTVITLSELKSFIGNATQSLAGLMSAQDKIDLDTLMALFDGDGDSVVNTIAEVLAIFESYPEGVDLVTALAGKVDKTTTIAGVDLANDITKEELQVALDVDDKVDKVTGKSLVEDTEITKLTELDNQATLDGKINAKESVVNKGDMSVINTTKYPHTEGVRNYVKDIGLDTPLTTLNNHTLREVFEDGNLVPNGNLSNINDFNLWIKNAQVTFDSVNNRTVIDTTNAVSLDSPIFPDINAGAVIYTIIDGYSTSQAPLAFRYRLNGVVDSETFTNMLFKQNRGFTSVINTYTRSFDQMAIVRNTINTTVYLYNIKFINLTHLGISSLTIQQMDYWYSVYQAIKNETTTGGLLATLYDLFSSKANTTLETWIAPTLINSWAGSTARYYKNNFGEIRLSGSITTGTIGTTAFTLPPGYRPSQIVRCPVESNGSFGYVVINTDGTVVPTAGSNVRFSLDGVYFRGA